MGISKIRPKENFQIGPMPPPSLPSVSGHLAPNRQSEGREGQTQEGCIVHQEGERLEDGQLSLKHQHSLVQTVARQRVSPQLSALPPRCLAVPASFAFSRLTCWILV